MKNSVRNAFYFGDNLHILREYLPDESVDLVYLDPPFNSNASYNLLFKSPDKTRWADAQIATFDDTWSWGDSAEETFEDVTSVPGKPADILLSLRLIPGTNDMLAYLTMMTARLAVDEQFEQHRRMIARPSRPSGCMTMKAKGGEVEFIDEEINDTGKVIFADPVLQTLRKERCLIPAHALDETRHAKPPNHVEV